MKNVRVIVKKSSLLAEGQLILSCSNLFTEVGDSLEITLSFDEDIFARKNLTNILNLISREYKDPESLVKYKRILDANPDSSTKISDLNISIEITPHTLLDKEVLRIHMNELQDRVHILAHEGKLESSLHNVNHGRRYFVSHNMGIEEF